MNADSKCSSLPVLPRLICRMRRLLMQQAKEQNGNRSAGSHLWQELATHEHMHSKNIRIECHRGKVWITETGSVHDTILSSGEAFESKSDVLVVVQALEPSCLHLKPRMEGIKP